MAPNYQISIMSPSADDKHVGDTIHIHVNFEDINGGTVHHIKVRIYNKDSGTEIYHQPTVAHVHETSGKYEHHDNLVLNVSEHTDWILEASVWGHEAGTHEKMDNIEFHVHP